MSIFNPVQGGVYDNNGQLVPDRTMDMSVIETPDNPTPADNIPNPDTPPSAPTPTAPQDIDWGTVLSEKTGGKFSTWDDLSRELNKPADIQIANEESKKVFDYLKEGKIDDVLQVYYEQRRLGYVDRMEDADVVKLAMEYKSSALSTEDINDEFSSKYNLEKPQAPIEDDYLDEDAFKKAQKDYQKELKVYEKEEKALQRSLKQDAVTAREYLAGLKKDIVLPDLQQNNQPAPTEAGPREEELQKALDNYRSSLNKTSESFKEIPFEVTDGDVTFKGSYQVEDAERVQLTKDLTEKNVIDDILLPRYIKGDVYDTNQLMSDIYFLNNKDKLISNAVKQAVAQDRLQRLKNDKNVDLNPGRGNGSMPNGGEAKDFARNFFNV